MTLELNSRNQTKMEKMDFEQNLGFLPITYIDIFILRKHKYILPKQLEHVFIWIVF